MRGVVGGVGQREEVLFGLDAVEAIEAFGVGVQPEAIFGAGRDGDGIVLEGLGGVEVEDKKEVGASEGEHMVVLVDFDQLVGFQIIEQNKAKI